MEHNAAVESNAVERYLLGDMPGEERDAFEEHFFSCMECAEEVRVGAHLKANWGGAERQARQAAPARSWANWLRWPSLIPVAASLVFAGVVWFQAGHQTMVGSYAEYRVEETVRDANAPIAVIPRGKGLVWVKFNVPRNAPPPPYECTVEDAAGKSVGTATVVTTTIDKEGKPEARIELDREHLRPGLYTIILGRDDAPVAPYAFRLQ